jgi:hypothetical protein
MGADHWIQRRPAPALRPLIDSYIGYRAAGRPGLHRGLPSRHLTLIAIELTPLGSRALLGVSRRRCR